jgi:serine kinase of HPr protein (carbohydrate metabolism regulator)
LGIARSAPPEQRKIIQHGTAVLLKSVHFEPSAVFLRGLSGSGKSDLACRLIEAGGELICDDQVSLEHRQDKIFADSVPAIRGLLEVRGIGLLRYPVADAARLRLVIDLVKHDEEVPRLPEPETIDIMGVALPRYKLYGYDVSAALKVFKAMEIVHHPNRSVK